MLVEGLLTLLLPVSVSLLFQTVKLDLEPTVLSFNLLLSYHDLVSVYLIAVWLGSQVPDRTIDVFGSV